jgi:hypothetical protein
MPESVKISALPAASSIQSTDLVPVVKMIGTTPAETNKATAGQIAAIGGGPPGANSVTDAAIANGAISAIKLGLTESQRIPISKTQTTVGGVTKFYCLETECSSWAQTLLAADNAAQGWSVLAANPNYSGPITVPRGSPTLPSYTFAGATDTGAFLTTDDDYSLTVRGLTRLAIGTDSTLYLTPPGGTELQPAIPIRSYAIFSPGNSAQTVNLPTAKSVGLFLGFNFYTSTRGFYNPPVIYNTATAQQGITAYINAKYGVSGVAPTFSSTSASSDGSRQNFTTPGDNDMIEIDANGNKVSGRWDTPAQGKTWVGQVTYTIPSGAILIKRHANVSSVTRSGNQFTLNFWTPMPDLNYGVLGSVGGTGSVASYNQVRVTAKTLSNCTVEFGNGSTILAPGNNDECFVAIVR